MLSTTQVGNLAGCSRFTVERACRDEELAATKVGRNWVIEDAEGKRWAEQYRPHARSRKKTSAEPGRAAPEEKDPVPQLTGEDLPGTPDHKKSGGSGPADGAADKAR